MIYNCLLGLVFTALFDKGLAEIYAIKYESQFYHEEFADKPALFGPSLKDIALTGMLVEANRSDACVPIFPPPNVENDVGKWIALVRRSSLEYKNCTFEMKVRNAQAAGYNAVIVYNVGSDELIPMGANNVTGIYIPAVFVAEKSGLDLLEKYANNPEYFIVINGDSPFDLPTHLLVPFSIAIGICFIVMVVFMIWKCIKDRRRLRRNRLPKSVLRQIPTHKFQKGDPFETCAICLDDYVEGEKLRVLPCNHAYHMKCIDPWLTKNRRVCPICKRCIWGIKERRSESDSDDTDTDDTSPLINPRNNTTQGGTFQEQSENPFQRAIRSISQTSGAATTNFVTASGHHSINGDYQSLDSSSEVTTNSSTTDTTESDMHSCCNTLEASSSHNNPFSGVNVRVVQADAVSNNSSLDGVVHA
ncbi:E3 ubiquitin-protein ligase RNF167-like [Diabrotica undecimpunctata]|uniref:E3 ubiquitin-protein ligase RNF167-like n=1 Tax=Diabrotica undecimpunctata TaxID=50387 RepID=UPI003B636C28